MLLPVQSAAEAVEGIVDIVEASGISPKVAKPLIGQLEAAQESLEAPNAAVRNDAPNKLSAFINKVNAQRGKKISEQQADMLIAEANRLLATL